MLLISHHLNSNMHTILLIQSNILIFDITTGHYNYLNKINFRDSANKIKKQRISANECINNWLKITKSFTLINSKIANM